MKQGKRVRHPLALLGVRLMAGFGAIIVGVSATYAAATAENDLFESEEAALSFTASLGPEWSEVASKQYCCEIEGLRMTRYRFKDARGLVHIGVDDQGRLRQYDVRYPITDNICAGVPETRTFARMLLESTEPAFANDMRNINRLGSSADLVWPQTVLASGPANQFGRTQFYFFRMNGFCTARLKRLPA